MSDPRRQRRARVAAFAAINAIAAWAGAVGLATGGLDLGARVDDRLPFDSVVLAGVALAVVVAVPLSALAWAAWQGAPATEGLACIVGELLIGWIVVQVVVLRTFSPFQPVYLCIGAIFVAASHRIRLEARARGVLGVLLGAIVLAAGLGLAPHVVKRGVEATSILSIVLLLTGAASVVLGVRLARRAGLFASLLSVLAPTALSVALALVIIAPAVAATNVPATHVTSTPDDLGLDFASVALRTDDGVELAAWFLEGTNGAGLVVVHGAGSTRSDVLAQSAALVRSGYSVVLFDARGHGASGGTAMDFGWYGDLDVGAATTYLASRAHVDPTRIGVVGFSMGGEEAIGAAATNPLIRAVVAEGATARRAADKEWLSDAYGWRGWVQERIERAQDGVTGYLAGTSAPISLRAAVADASQAHFLLITAGRVGDEGRAASYMRSGADERVTTWNVDGAGHVGAYAARPDEWRGRVVEFLDEHLR